MIEIHKYIVREIAYNFHMSLMAVSWLKNSVITEVVFAVLPVVVFLFAFQFLIMKRPIENVYQILIGIALSTAGLILFLEGLKLGFLPLGHQIGASLPASGSVYLVVAFGSVFGYAITLAEPNLRVLINQVETVSSGLSFCININLFCSAIYDPVVI